MALVLVILLNVCYFEVLELRAPEFVMGTSILSTQLVASALTYLTTIPVVPLGQQYVSGMNRYSIFVNALLIWVPAIPLVVGFLNLNELLYRTAREVLFFALVKLRMV